MQFQATNDVFPLEFLGFDLTTLASSSRLECYDLSDMCSRIIGISVKMENVKVDSKSHCLSYINSRIFTLS